MAKEIVTDSNAALLDKEHVCNFIFLVENQVDRFLPIKSLRLKTKADVVKELGVSIFIRIEEVAVLEDDVVEKVFAQDVVFYPSRTLVQIFVILGETLQAILCPKIGKVTINLTNKLFA